MDAISWSFIMIILVYQLIRRFLAVFQNTCWFKNIILPISQTEFIYVLIFILINLLLVCSGKITKDPAWWSVE